jgi:tripartite-type tricarboxylate transporter receptor subunit TctC
MKLPRRNLLHLAAGAAALPAVSRIAAAQAYPTRPVTMVVTFPPGSGSDILARILSPRLSELLGQQVIIESVGAGGGITGAYRVARAAPDGYQFVLGGTEWGATALPGSPADFGKLVAEETEKWGKVVKFAGVKAD